MSNAGEIRTPGQRDILEQALRSRIEQELAKPEGQQNLEAIKRGAVQLQQFRLERGGPPVPEDLAPAVPPGQEAGSLSEVARGFGADAFVQTLRRTTTGMRDVLGLDTEEVSEQRRDQLHVDAAEQSLAREQQIRQLGFDPERMGTKATMAVFKFGGSFMPELPLALALPEIGGFALGTTILRGVRIQSSYGRILGETLAGAGGLAFMQTDDPSISNAMIGAGLGGGLGTLIELPNMARRALMIDAKRAFANPRTYLAYERARTARIRVGLSEAAADDRVVLYDAAMPNTPGSPNARFAQRQNRDVFEALTRFNDALNPEHLSTETVITQLRKAYADSVATIKDFASNRFRTNIEEGFGTLTARFDERGGGTLLGGQRFIEPNNVKQQLNIALEAASDMDGLAPSGYAAWLDEQLKLFTEAGEQGGLRIGAVQSLLSDWTDQAYGSGTVVTNALTAKQRIASRGLLDALLDDLGEAGQAMGSAHPRAAAALQHARAQYKVDLEVLHQMQGETIEQLLSKVGADPTSTTFIQTLLKLDDTSYNRLMSLADEARPGLADAIRGRQFMELMDRHSVLPRVGERGAQIAISDMMNEVAKMGGRKQAAFLGHGQTGPLANQIEAAFKTLRDIAAGPRGQRANLPPATQQFSSTFINALSLNPGFVGRFISGRLAPGFFEKMLYTPNGWRILTQIGDPKLTRAAATATAAQLVELMVQSDRDLEQAKARIQARQGNPAGQGVIIP